MFAVEVRDHIMIAHSFRGAVFGPAQALHGATFVIDAAFIAETLDDNGIVIDIGRAHDALKAVVATLNYRNLDEVPEFKGRNTTTEFLTRHIFDQLAKGARAGEFGRDGRELKSIRDYAFRVACRARLVRGRFVVKRFAFAVPGDLATPTGGYAYDRRMIAELGDLGWQVDLLDLGEGFPWPSDATRAAALTQLLSIPAGRTIVVDGLALGALPEAASQLAGRNPLLALVHHPLALEAGLSDEQADTLRSSERAALSTVRGVVVTSASTARLVAADYGVPAASITIAKPGSDPAPPAQGSRDGVVRLLSVGAVVPRKGFDVLIAALATLGDLPWQLTIAGDRTRDPMPRQSLMPISSVTAWKIGLPCSVRYRRNISRRSMQKPTCSRLPLTSKAMAWPTPRLLRMACP